MLALLLTAWSAARVAWWDDPFAPMARARPAHAMALQVDQPRSALPLQPQLARARDKGAGLSFAEARPATTFSWRRDGRSGVRRPAPFAVPADPSRFAGLQLPSGQAEAPAPGRTPASVPFNQPASPFMPAPTRAGRWSVDAWAFWRQGSAAAPVSQGRVPVYGASQAGAVLQYRLAPAAPRDPRLFLRAYRALIQQGESELALGASARPLARLPLRAVGEVRYTDAAFSNQWRPAAYLVTEIAPITLPYGAQLEAYGQAGWVGGRQPTPFADGQASLTGEVRQVARVSDQALRLSAGAGLWGGAQNDAQRVDIGPTLRLDLRVGAVPARVTVDWRRRVAGDASPGSGVAVTLSTRF